MMRLAFWLLLLWPNAGSVDGQIDTAPGLPRDPIHVPGDLMIGALFSITGNELGVWTGRCQDNITLDFIETAQMLLELIDEVNANRSKLNGIRLGITMYDFCARDLHALAQATRFMPTDSQPQWRYVSIICCASSVVTALVSKLTSAYEIPQISYSAINDGLSNKKNYEFFLRTISSTKYLIRGIVKILNRFKWSYVAVLYSEGIFGDDCMRNLYELIEKQTPPLCVAYSRMIYQTKPAENMPQIVDELLGLAEVRVVVLFINSAQVNMVLTEMKRRNVTKRFVWLGTGNWYRNVESTPVELHETAAGAMSLMSTAEGTPDMYKFLTDAAYAEDKRNPWLVKYWERRFKCQWKVTCNVSSIPASQRAPIAYRGAQFYDAFSVIVNGLESYLRTINHSIERFSSRGHLQAMKDGRFEGRSGHIIFDQNGDLQGKYTFLHAVRRENGFKVITVGEWNTAESSLTVDEGQIGWLGEPHLQLPESLCSRPCSDGHVKIHRELVCCWECFRCRENEVPNQNASFCVECPAFTWPDASLAACTPIVPSYVTYTEALGITLLSVAAVGTLITLTTVGFFIWHNNHRLVRASCREASFVLLFGIEMDFLLLILLVGEPSDSTCYALRFGLHLTSTLIYAPILIKTVKIFRIFREGKRLTRAPKFIGKRVQFSVIILLIVVESIVIAVSSVLYPPVAQHFMATRTEPAVEMICNESVLSMCMGLAFNFALIVGCAGLAFTARNLPDNYNESSQVAFSVLITMILWVVFVPAWLALTSAYKKIAMISLAITMNALVHLVGLFFPKVFALLARAPQNPHNFSTQVATQSNGDGD